MGCRANRNMKKRPEEIISDIKEEVAAEFFAENPLKRFPEDFLSRRVKTESAVAKAMADKFEEILLPGGRLKLKFEKKVQICFESGMVLSAFAKASSDKLEYDPS